MIRTHVLEMIDGCKVWRWEWLTGAQWSALRHVTEVVIALGCAGGPIGGVLPAGPGGTGYLPPSVASLSPPGGAGCPATTAVWPWHRARLITAIHAITV